VRKLGTAIVVCVACVCIALPANAGVAPKTKLVSVSSSEEQGNSDSQYNVAITPNARFVAFQSDADNLAAADGDGLPDVFLRDRKQGRTTLVSREKVPAADDGGSGVCGLDMTPDHRYVAFDSDSERLVPHDDNSTDDVFVRDLKKGKTSLVSVSSSGKRANGSSCYDVHISADGRYVAFASDATKLVHHDDNGAADVFVRDLKRGTTTLVSKAASGGVGEDSSGVEGIDMSATGRFVAFDSLAEDLVGSDGNTQRDVFVRDLRSGKTRLVSVSSSESQGGADSEGAAMSPSGRFIAFTSEAEDLAGNDGNGNLDVFLRDRKKGMTRLVSLASNGDAGEDHSGYQATFGHETMAVSGDGRYVAFDSFAENLTGNDGNGWIDVFVRDMKKHKTRLVSEALGGTSGNDESAYYAATMTPDARYVVFNSGADDLVGSDPNGSTYDIFIRGPLRP
jgi:Tol biopolymer transport system component